MLISFFTAHMVSTLAIKVDPDIPLMFTAPLSSCFFCFLCCNSKHLLKLHVQVYQLKKGLCLRQVSSLSSCPLPAALNTPEAAKKGLFWAILWHWMAHLLVIFIYISYTTTMKKSIILIWISGEPEGSPPFTLLLHLNTMVVSNQLVLCWW